MAAGAAARARRWRGAAQSGRPTSGPRARRGAAMGERRSSLPRPARPAARRAPGGSRDVSTEVSRNASRLAAQDRKARDGGAAVTACARVTLGAAAPAALWEGAVPPSHGGRWSVRRLHEARRQHERAAATQPGHRRRLHARAKVVVGVAPGAVLHDESDLRRGRRMVAHRPEVGVVREEERLARRRSWQREAVQRQRACPAEMVAQLPAGGPHRQRHRSARRLGGCQDWDWLWLRSRCCPGNELRSCLPVAPGADTCRAEGGAIGAAVATCASGAVAAAHRGARLDGRAPVGTAVGVRRADEGVAPPPLEDRRHHAIVGRVRRSGRESRRPGGVEGRPLPALAGLPHLGLRRRLERPVQHREAEPSARVDLVHEGGRVAQ
mmetsp:Transcript_21145/g.67567  ORF Transcript_21145/g.67567 Transcript_21145/m.67567 type:complete len:381 (+) Transcript_21145:526-1668(+)